MIWTLTLVLLLAATPPLPVGPPPQTVALRFAWPEGLRAKVTSTKTRTRDVRESSSRSATSSYTLAVDTHEEKLRIRFLDARFSPGEGFEGLPAEVRAQVVPHIAHLVPDYLVTKGGEFAGIVDLAALKKGLEDLFGAFLPAEADPELVSRLRAGLLSESLLQSKAAEEWNAIVGAWIGADLEIGSEYAYGGKEPAPAIPGEEILMSYRFLAKRLLPCRRGGVERTCVELELRSASDPEDSQRVTSKVLERLVGGKAGEVAPLRALAVENSIRLVTEPDGLVPHELDLVRNFRGAVRFEGKDQPFEQVDRTETRFVYP